jgi:FixJ family two-component response regulator
MLTDNERAQFAEFVAASEVGAGVAVEDRVGVRACQVRANKQVAVDLRVSPNTVNKWHARLLAPPGRPPWILLEKVEEVISGDLGAVPANATHWSRASMVKKSGLSKSSIGRIWRSVRTQTARQ